jgi:hypothetical protein
MSSSDLDELVQLILARRDNLNTSAMMSLRIGQQVIFTGKRGRMITGTVAQMKRNGKLEIKQCSDGMTWRVPASMVSPYTPAPAPTGKMTFTKLTP